MGTTRDGVPVAPAPVASDRVRPLVWVGFALLAAVAGGLPSFSHGATLMVLGVGGVLFWVGLSRRAAPGPSGGGLPRGAGWWIMPLGALILAEAVNFALGSTYEHPTLSLLADPWLERYPVRAGAFFGWTAVFWTLARR